MNFNMITMRRGEKNSIDRTLDALFSSDWEGGIVNLIVGSPDETYLSRWVGDSRVNIISYDATDQPEELQNAIAFRRLKTKPVPPIHNRRWNIGLGINIALRCGWGFFAEDDITFTPGWNAKLNEFVRQLPKDKPYILNCQRRQAPVPEIMTGVLIGSQCLYFSSHDFQKQCVEWFAERYNHQNLCGCTDALLGDFAKKFGTLYGVRLVNHDGGPVHSTFVKESAITERPM